MSALRIIWDFVVTILRDNGKREILIPSCRGIFPQNSEDKQLCSNMHIPLCQNWVHLTSEYHYNSRVDAPMCTMVDLEMFYTMEFFMIRIYKGFRNKFSLVAQAATLGNFCSNIKCSTSFKGSCVSRIQFQC